VNDDAASTDDDERTEVHTDAPVISGEGKPGATVTVVIDGPGGNDYEFDVVVGEDGTWTLDLGNETKDKNGKDVEPLVEGDYDITVSQGDPGGNNGGDGAHYYLEVILTQYFTIKVAAGTDFENTEVKATLYGPDGKEASADFDFEKSANKPYIYTYTISDIAALDTGSYKLELTKKNNTKITILGIEITPEDVESGKVNNIDKFLNLTAPENYVASGSGSHYLYAGLLLEGSNEIDALSRALLTKYMYATGADGLKYDVDDQLADHEVNALDRSIFFKNMYQEGKTFTFDRATAFANVIGG
jgi:hypothetical protein